MRKPVILITPTPADGHANMHISHNYNFAIRDNGGVPVMPGLFVDYDDVDHLVSLCDGVLFSGGDDVDPSRYGELVHSGCGTITPDRDELEINMYKACLKYKKPMLGICRGIQVINVAAGGSCWQDLPGEYPKQPDCPVLQHRQRTDSFIPTQEAVVTEGSLLAKITGKDILKVNTFHHQACKELGEGWQVAARARDGVIEAIENPSMKFGLAVQWHPEHLYAGHEEHRNIIKAFIAAASEGCR